VGESVDDFGSFLQFRYYGNADKSHPEVKRKNEFQNGLQQKQEERHRIFSPRYLGHRGGLIGGSRLRSGQHKHDNDLHEPDERGVPINLFELQRPLPQHGLLRGEQHLARSIDRAVFILSSEWQAEGRLPFSLPIFLWDGPGCSLPFDLC